VVACGCVGALLLGACGRLGFELLGDDRASPPPPGDAGLDRDAQVGGSGTGGASAGSRSMPPMDAATDAQSTLPDSGVPNPGMDAQADTGSMQDAGGDAALDAGADAALDAGADAAPDAGGCQLASVTDYCTELPALPAAPLIDGELDCGPPLLDVTPVGWTSTTSPLPAGFSARLAVAWRPDGVYFFLDVTDPTRLPPPPPPEEVWCGDGVELYLDDNGTYAASPMYDNPGSIQALAIAPANDTNPVTSGGERYRSPNGGLLVGAWTSPRYGAFPRPGGYTFEAFMMADDIDLASWTLSAGGSVGLNVSLNVSTSANPPPAGETPACGLRLGQYFLHIAGPPCTTSCLPFATAAAFCNPVLQ